MYLPLNCVSNVVPHFCEPEDVKVTRGVSWLE